MTSSTAGPPSRKQSSARPSTMSSTKFSHATTSAGKPGVRVCRRSWRTQALRSKRPIALAPETITRRSTIRPTMLISPFPRGSGCITSAYRSGTPESCTGVAKSTVSCLRSTKFSERSVKEFFFSPRIVLIVAGIGQYGGWMGSQWKCRF